MVYFIYVNGLKVPVSREVLVWLICEHFPIIL